MESIFLIAIVIIAIVLTDTRTKLKKMQSALDDLQWRGASGPNVVEDAEPAPDDTPTSAPAVAKEQEPADILRERLAKIDAEQPKEKPARKAPATVISASVPRAAAATPPPPPAATEHIEPEPVEPGPTIAHRFEKLVGERLPIWIGGIALIFAAFFLVRYSIEAGLLGPRVRSIAAALFGILLLAISQYGSKIPKIGTAFSDDKRIGQSLAGAGIAILYGTLYMASELYGLIGLTTAFILVVAVTILALILALREGPPTAIMGLLGGFAAPYVAGLGPESMGPLLVYLGIFTIGLFALAIHRGWIWLALLATGGSVLWSSVLMILQGVDDTPFVGIFILLLAVGGVMTLSRIKQDGNDLTKRLLNSAPLAIGLLQLAFLAPTIEFGLFGWVLYGLLSAFALFLGWRDKTMSIGAAAALALFVAMQVGAYMQNPVAPFTPWATLIMAVMFGGVGHWLAYRKEDGWVWTLIGLGAPTAAFAVPYLWGNNLLTSNNWAWLALPPALAAAFMAWRGRPAKGENADQGENDRNMLMVIATGTATALAVAPAITWPSHVFVPSTLLLIALALAGWAKYLDNKAIRLMVFVPIILASLAAFIATFDSGDFAEAIGDDRIPSLVEMLGFGILPAIIFAAIAWLLKGSRIGSIIHWFAFIAGTFTLMALLPLQWTAALFAALALIAGYRAVSQYAPPLAAQVMTITGLCAMAVSLLPFGEILAQSLAGETEHFGYLPTIGSAVIELALPALILLVALIVNGAGLGDRFKGGVSIALAIVGGALAYLFLKQPLAIASYDQFMENGFLERAILTQILMVSGYFAYQTKLAERFANQLRPIGLGLFALGIARFVYFDLLLLNPAMEQQAIGSIPMLNFATIHFGLIAFWLWMLARNSQITKAVRPLEIGSLLAMIATMVITVKQAVHGSFIADTLVTTQENYLYSAGLLALALAWLWFGLRGGIGLLRVAGLLLLTIVTLKVFLIDASALEGILRIVSFLGLGIALMAIGWAYPKIMNSGGEAQPAAS